MRFCQLQDPRRTLCFQSSWLDFEDLWIVVHNAQRSPGMGGKEPNLRQDEQKVELTFLKYPLCARHGDMILF